MTGFFRGRGGFFEPLAIPLGYPSQFVVAGEEVWAVPDLLAALDSQLFDEGNAMGGVCEREIDICLSRASLTMESH